MSPSRFNASAIQVGNSKGNESESDDQCNQRRESDNSFENGSLRFRARGIDGCDSDTQRAEHEIGTKLIDQNAGCHAEAPKNASIIGKPTKDVLARPPASI